MPMDQIVPAPDLGHKPRLPMALSAEYLRDQIADLYAWRDLTGQPLPLPARLIAGLEALGFIVDLNTGEFWRPEPAPVDRGRPPTSCPYCGSRKVSGHLGRWECSNCGGEGSY